MANPIGQKKLAVYDSREVGEIVESPINLEAATKGKWLPLLGQDIERSKCPELGNLFPIGVFECTTRTLAATPGSPYYALVADNTNFLCNGTTGTDALQASADGITWVTTTGGWAASTAFHLLRAGPRLIALPQSGESQPYVTPIDTYTAAQLVAKANWTVTTGGSITSNAFGAAYNPNNGVTVMIVEGSLATSSAVFSLSNNSDTTWAAASGGSTANRQGICFDGQKFIIQLASVENKYQTVTADGLTVADAYFPFSITSAVGIASDGAGTIVITASSVMIGGSFTGAGFIVSKDYGATWRFISTQKPYFNGLHTYIYYVNGYFIAGANSNKLISVDGVTWYGEPVGKRGVTATSAVGGAYKSGVWFFSSSTSIALTAIENRSKFRLPIQGGLALSAAGYVEAPPTTLFIKARSN